MTTCPQVIVGTYEQFVLGYKLNSDGGGKNFNPVQSFATHSHQASVRCITSHGHLVASSGADEYINIYNMDAMEVSTVINYHNATVTCLEFTKDGSHLVTANQNGDIAIFQCKDWTLVKLWKEAHKHANGVTSTCIHPSGSLLMTTGADNVVTYWNLVKGRKAYATNFSKKCSLGNFLSFGIWSTNGEFYVICIGHKLEVYETETAAMIYEIQTSSKATCAVFIKKSLICVGTEEGTIEIHSVTEKKLYAKEAAHKSRVKNMSFFSMSAQKNTKIIKKYLVSTESKGKIKLWQIKKKDTNYLLDLKCEIDCDCRITCLTLLQHTGVNIEE